jgi:hypothetical protein
VCGIACRVDGARDRDVVADFQLADLIVSQRQSDLDLEVAYTLHTHD